MNFKTHNVFNANLLSSNAQQLLNHVAKYISHRQILWDVLKNETRDKLKERNKKPINTCICVIMFGLGNDI